ncbi:hypothetical protein BaRGS_00037938, partial [Batillaria attramentaria]
VIQRKVSAGPLSNSTNFELTTPQNIRSSLMKKLILPSRENMKSVAVQAVRQTQIEADSSLVIFLTSLVIKQMLAGLFPWIHAHKDTTGIPVKCSTCGDKVQETLYCSFTGLDFYGPNTESDIVPQNSLQNFPVQFLARVNSESDNGITYTRQGTAQAK